MSPRAPTHFAFSPKTQNAKLAAPISSASTGAASNLSQQHGKQTCGARLVDARSPSAASAKCLQAQDQRDGQPESRIGARPAKPSPAPTHSRGVA